MLINRRNAMMTGKRLPYDAEVEYLESTGTQWIDTGVYLTGNDEVSANVLFTASQNTRGVWGCYIRGTWRYELKFAPSGYAEAGYGPAKQYSGMSLPVNTRLLLAQQKDGFYVNGNKLRSFTAASFTQSLTAYVFHFNMSNNSYSPCLAKFYSFKIKRGDFFVRDFIPVRFTNELGQTEGAMYDRVTKKLFRNAGTGDFTLGPDVVPVEWLGAFNGPYIDTAVRSDTDVSMEVEAAFEWDQLSTESSFGSYFGCDAAGGRGAIFIGFIADKTSLRAYFGNSSGNQDIYIPINSSFNTFFCSKDVSRINEQSSIVSGTPSIINPIRIFLFRNNVNWSGGSSRPKCRVKYSKFYKGSTLVRSFRPVRVGTDATSWEGAMMDVLTRRIYRNAGTGAFSYGNDLEYPIPAE